MITATKSFMFRGKEWTIYKCPDGIWRDLKGTEYGVSEDENSVDPRPVCGVGWFTLPDDDPRNAGCLPHEFKYSCALYQRDHRRSEADNDLERDQRNLGYPIFGWLARRISRILGGFKNKKVRLWENDHTRDL